MEQITTVVNACREEFSLDSQNLPPKRPATTRPLDRGYERVADVRFWQPL